MEKKTSEIDKDRIELQSDDSILGKMHPPKNKDKSTIDKTVEKKSDNIAKEIDDLKITMNKNSINKYLPHLFIALIAAAVTVFFFEPLRGIIKSGIISFNNQSQTHQILRSETNQSIDKSHNNFGTTNETVNLGMDAAVLHHLRAAANHLVDKNIEEAIISIEQAKKRGSNGDDLIELLQFFKKKREALSKASTKKQYFIWEGIYNIFLDKVSASIGVEHTNRIIIAKGEKNEKL